MENVYIHFIASIFVRIDLCKFRVNIEVTTISKFISQLHTHTHSYASSLILYRYTYTVRRTEYVSVSCPNFRPRSSLNSWILHFVCCVTVHRIHQHQMQWEQSNRMHLQYVDWINNFWYYSKMNVSMEWWMNKLILLIDWFIIIISSLEMHCIQTQYYILFQCSNVHYAHY